MWSSCILHLLLASWEGTMLTVTPYTLWLCQPCTGETVTLTLLFHSGQWYDRQERGVWQNEEKSMCLWIDFNSCSWAFNLEFFPLSLQPLFLYLSSYIPSIFFPMYLICQSKWDLMCGCGHTWHFWFPAHSFLSHPQKSKLESIKWKTAQHRICQCLGMDQTCTEPQMQLEIAGGFSHFFTPRSLGWSSLKDAVHLWNIPTSSHQIFPKKWREKPAEHKKILLSFISCLFNFC